MSDEQELVSNLSSENWETRAEAEAALYDASQSVVPHLLEVVRQPVSEENRSARRISAWIIYKVGPRITDAQLRGAAASTLIQALGDEDGGLRKNAAWGLAAIGQADAVQPLEAARQDKSADVRDAAEYALQQVSGRT